MRIVPKTMGCMADSKTRVVGRRINMWSWAHVRHQPDGERLNPEERLQQVRITGVGFNWIRRGLLRE
jgi:hypothetical protein